MSQDDSLPHKAWSTDTLAALELRDFISSICRAFLLYQNKFFGEYINAKFESAMKNSKRRSAKIIEMWKNKERKSD